VFEHEGGGRGGRNIETAGKKHLQITFGCEGGGTGAETSKKLTSSSRLNVRKVEEGQAC